MVNFAAYLQPSLSNENTPPQKLFDLMNIKGGTVYNRSKEETDKLLEARKKELFRWLYEDQNQE